MNKKFLLTFTILPLALSGANFVHTVKANEDVQMTTFDYSTTNNVDTIDGRTLLKELKYSDKTWDEIENNELISAEMDFVNKRYEVKYDAAPEELSKAFNWGYIEPYYYVEGFKFDDFIPKYVLLNNKTYPFTEINGGYQFISAIENVSSLDGAKIVYEHKIVVEPYVANEIINAAYNVALDQKTIQDKIDAYEAYENYVGKLEKFDQYKIDYAAAELKNDNIDNYKAAKAQYDDFDKPAYDSYLEALNTYNQKVEKYKEFLLADSSYKANAENIAKAEQKYSDGMDLVNFQLGNMEYFYAGQETFPGVEAGGTIFHYLFTNAVSMVTDESNEFLFTNAGIRKEIMGRARSATYNLKRLLTSYNTLRGDSTPEGIKARYQFLINNSNGKTIKDSLIVLTQCLENFFNNPNVRNEMDRREKTQRYIYLLSELIYVSSLFSQNSFDNYDGHYSASSSNAYKINSSTELEGNPVNEILGVSALNAETLKTSNILSSFPVTAESIYGTKPKIGDYVESEYLEEVGGVIQVKAPPVVNKPIEPFKADYDLADDEALTKVSLPDYTNSKYGLSASDFVNGELIPVEKPAGEIKPQRNEEFNIFYDSLMDGTLGETNTFDSNQEIFIDKIYDFNSSNIDKQNIAVMQIAEAGQSPRIHEIAFFDDNESPVLQHEIPPTAVSGQTGVYNYCNRWLNGDVVKELSEIRGESINLTAGFLEQPLTTYTVQWYDGANLLLENEGYYGFRPVFVKNDREEIPTKDSTETQKFVFSGFTYNHKETPSSQTIEETTVTKIFDVCGTTIPDNSGVIRIDVKFETKPLYKVTFYDSDENNDAITISNIGEFKGLEAGARIGHDSPKKAASNGKRFVFDHWEILNDSTHTPVKLPVNVIDKNIELVAKYKIIKLFKVNFLDSDINGSLIYGNDLDYEEGDTPSTPTGLSKSFSIENNEYYEFNNVFVDGNNNTLSTLTNNTDNSSTIIYKPVFTPKKIVENASISVDSNVLTITADQGINNINVAKFNQLIGQNFAFDSMKVVFGDKTLEFSNSQARQLYAKKVATLGITGDSSLTFVVKDNIEFANVRGVSATVVLSNLSEASHMRAYVGDRRINATSMNETGFRFNINSGEKVDIGTYYSLSFDSMSNASFKVNGVDVENSDELYFKKGQEIVVEATPSEGYKVNGISMQQTSSTTNTCTFNISGDQVISADTSKLKFKVTIYIDGEIANEYEVDYGTTFMLEDAVKESDDSYDYVFLGWEEFALEQTNSIVVTSNVSLNAVFDEIIKQEVVDETVLKNNQFISTVLTALFIAIGVGLLFSVFFIIFVKRSKDDEDDKNNYINKDVN